MNQLLIIVDMQNDFVSGSLPAFNVKDIIPVIKEKIKIAIHDGKKILFTKDTHSNSYLTTQEGRLLPVEHCIQGTRGHQIIPELAEFANKKNMLIKHSFGYPSWSVAFKELYSSDIDIVSNGFDQIELAGVCSDICVVSNVAILKSQFPEVEIIVDSKATAGTSAVRHQAALEIMKSLQVKVI